MTRDRLPFRRARADHAADGAATRVRFFHRQKADRNASRTIDGRPPFLFAVRHQSWRNVMLPSSGAAQLSTRAEDRAIGLLVHRTQPTTWQPMPPIPSGSAAPQSPAAFPFRARAPARRGGCSQVVAIVRSRFKWNHCGLYKCARAQTGRRDFVLGLKSMTYLSHRCLMRVPGHIVITVLKLTRAH